MVIQLYLYKYNEVEIKIFYKCFRFHHVLEITNQNVNTGVHSGLSHGMDSKEQLPDPQFLFCWALWSRWTVSWPSKFTVWLRFWSMVKQVQTHVTLLSCRTRVQQLFKKWQPGGYRWDCESHHNLNDDFSLPSRNLSVTVIWIRSYPFRQIAHENTEPLVG